MGNKVRHCRSTESQAKPRGDTWGTFFSLTTDIALLVPLLFNSQRLKDFMQKITRMPQVCIWWVMKGHGQNNNVNNRTLVWPRYIRWTKQYEEYDLNRNLEHIPITVCPCMLSHFCHVQLFATPWTVAHQGPLFMGYFRREYWSGLPCPPPGIFPNQGLNSRLFCLLNWQVYS